MKKKYKDVIDSTTQLSEDFMSDLIQQMEQKKEGKMKRAEKIEVKESSTVTKFIAVLATAAALVLGVMVGMKYLKPVDPSLTTPATVEATKESQKPVTSETKEAQTPETKETEKPVVTNQKKIPIDIMLGEHPVLLHAKSAQDYLGNVPLQGEAVNPETLKVYLINSPSEEFNQEEYDKIVEKMHRIAKNLGWTIEQENTVEFYKTRGFAYIQAEEGSIDISNLSNYSVLLYDTKMDHIEFLKKMGYKNPTEIKENIEEYKEYEPFHVYYDMVGSPEDMAYHVTSSRADTRYYVEEGKELLEFNFWDPTSNELIGEYPAISAKEARERLNLGYAYSTYEQTVKPENVLGVKLEYLIGLDGYVSPYYTFVVSVGQENGLHVFDTYYVPALEDTSYEKPMEKINSTDPGLIPDLFKEVKTMKIKDLATQQEKTISSKDLKTFIEALKEQGILVYEKNKVDSPKKEEVLKEGYEVIFEYADGEVVQFTYPLYSFVKDGKRSDYYKLENLYPLKTYLEEFMK